jgi:nicotinate phosphoribosyltransferase
MPEFSNALLTDLYELTMAQAYWRSGVTGTATFSLFFRRYPMNRGYFVAAGLEDVLDYLESLSFSDADIGYLESLELFDSRFLRWLRRLRFTGEVRAMAEGTICFIEEPIVEVRAPAIEAQIVETFLLNQLTFQSMLATKASRVVHAARGRSVVDFAARRTQGLDAANKAARVGYLVGYAGTSNVQAAARYGIPPVGTMAHSFVMSFEHEIDAFRAYAHCFPDTTTLLVDTYDTMAGVRNAIEVALEMEREGHRLRAVRLDSGDMAALAVESRRLLDEAGLRTTQIFASGGLDEHELASILASGAPIDAFGVGTRAGVSADAPYIDSAYKLVEYEGRPVLKLSAGKQSLPGCKQVFRVRGRDGQYDRDIIARLEEEPPAGDVFPLLVEVMRDGQRIAQQPSLAELRHSFLDGFARLPDRYKVLESPPQYPVEISARLQGLRSEVTEAVRVRELGE